MGEGEGGESSWGRSKSCRAHEKSFIQLSFRKTYVVFAYISNPFFPSSAPTLSDRWWSCSTGEPTSSFNRPRVFNTFARILSSRFLFSSSLLPSPLHEEPRIQLGFNLEKRKKGRIVYRGNFDLYQREGTIFSLQPFFSSLLLFLRLPPLPNWIPRSTA